MIYGILVKINFTNQLIMGFRSSFVCLTCHKQIVLMLACLAICKVGSFKLFSEQNIYI